MKELLKFTIKATILIAVIMCSGVVIYDSWQQNVHSKKINILPPSTSETARVPRLEISKPEAEAIVSSPLQVVGKVNPDWFINGPIEIRLVNDLGKVISNKVTIENGTPDSDGMVSFKVLLEFTPPSRSYGFVEIQRPKGFNEGLPYKYRLHVLFQ
jgi:hypothetical protein